MTPRQRALYDFIGRYWAEYGFAPTFEAMAMGCDLKTKSQVHRLVHAMVGRGHLAMIPGLRRTVRCVSDDERQAYANGYEAGYREALAHQRISPNTNYSQQPEIAG